MALVTTQQASSSSSRCSYHVFLSFRDKDTGKTFTDHLYTALVQAGFRTFKEINKGNNIKSELVKAIQQSRISLIVFSKDYASSTSCLDELVTIHECRMSSGHVILPIFYDVDPSDVRKQTGSIGEAFAKYEEELKAETIRERKKEWILKIKKWRAVLKDVADLAGLELQNQADGHESKFIQKIIKVIEDKLNRVVLHVARYPVGIHSRVKSINLWLQDRSSNIDVLLICGMGGIGKTTIAKFIYNSNFEGFEGSSFVADVRENSEHPRGLIRLQRQILSDILKRKKEKISNVDQGTIRIEDAICSKRILIVLDDVAKGNQLDVLLGRQQFYPGSKIIVTTRHKLLVNAHEVHKVHTVEQLDDNESMELFSWHAFGQEHPIEGYMELSKRVVNRCGGLPLAHEVLGSSLSGKSKDVWISALEKLEAIPDSQIHEKLKISFESLPDDHDKNLFLHIACFFVRKAKDNTIKILNECKFYTTYGIETLIHRCLITIDKDNKVMMHQLLQEMGREIVRQESPKEPGNRSRLWHHEDSFDVLKEKMGTKIIEGLVLDMHMFKEDESDKSSFDVSNAKKRRFKEFLNQSFLSSQATSSKRRSFSLFSWQSADTSSLSPNEVDLKFDAFARMDNLKLLQLNYVQLNGCYENFPEKLRWLCWHGFPSKSIPMDFPLDNLVSLDMRYSKLEQLWKGTKSIRSLKILNLSHCQRLSRTPNFSELPNIEKLILKGCVRLAEVCESIGSLKGLIVLNLEDCTNLRKFPNIGKQRFLEILIISGCSSLGEFPMELSTMESLKELQADRFSLDLVSSATREVRWWDAFILSWVSKPRKSPRNFWDSLPCSLANLSVADCNLSDDSFPRSFSNLSMLQNLNLSQNPICGLPECVKSLSRLKKLYLNSCKSLQLLLDVPAAVETLHVEDNTSLERITYSSLNKSKDLTFTRCSILDEIQGLFKLEPIEKVERWIIKNLGLFDLELLRNVEVKLHNTLAYEKKCPIQGLYEFNIFSTFIPGREVLSWFTDKTKRSSISFTVPNRRIEGLTVCSMYSLSNKEEIWYPRPLFIKINNKTKDLTWIYCPLCYGIPEVDENLLWLSHWTFGNQLATDDEVTVSVVMGDGFQVNEFGIKIVYGETDKDTTLENNIYISSKLFGGDLTTFQVSTGTYFLSHHAFSFYDGVQKMLTFEDWTIASWFEQLFGNSIEFEDIDLKSWAWWGGSKGLSEWNKRDRLE